MKKILSILGMIVSIGLLVACTPDSSEKVDITINLTSGPLALEIGETYQLDITTNDEAGYVIEVSNDTVISVSETGLVTALAVGSSTVSVTSISDDTVSKLVTINVTKVNNLSIVEPTSYLWTDQTLQLTYEADGDVAFESSDVNVATIDADGLITAIAPGAFTVTMKLSSDDSIFTTIDLVVYDIATTIMLDGDTKANMGTPVTLTATVGPDNSAPAILWSSSDESVATIDALGVVTPLSAGIVTIMATSMTDESIQATHELVIVNEIIVDGTKSEGDSVDIDSLSFTFGEKLFNNLEDALDVAVDGVTIRLYDIDVTSAHVLSLNNFSLIGMNENVTVSENLTIDGNDVLIENLSFINQGAIEVLPLTQNVSIMSNTFNQLNNSIDSAIMIHEAHGLLIESNIFTNLDNHAILVNAIIDGLLEVNKNTIDQVGVAVKIMGEDYSSDTSIQIVRNQLSNIEGGFEVLLDSTEILAYARFNSVTDYSAFPAKTNAQSNVDFTLNYWG